MILFTLVVIISVAFHYITKCVAALNIIMTTLFKFKLFLFTDSRFYDLSLRSIMTMV